ncbi:2OG-Fe(II) oxygenase-like protein 5 [Elsinoe australis]|uniref:2OG-Fe(II) oxygenase-like protein 5 n=1 Tax=Elsinoe australis TaxID=40998 RepID=A0A4U7ATZ0_9PEZI|nr:2OG-Fe(II) oxygenase-like protein 5 [Elsinoe australis]
MEAFVTKKRQRSTPHLIQYAEEESTEVKLAILESLQPGLPQDVLLDALLSCDGNVDKAAASLSGVDTTATTLPPLKRFKSVGYQSSISSTFRSPSGVDKPVVPRPLTKKGRTLHLFTPEDIEAHTPCSIIHNFLPASQADALLRELLEEAPTYWKGEFQMFDRTVLSPHTFCFYVKDEQAADEQRKDYYYQGAEVPDVRTLRPEMRKVSLPVQDAVNNEIERRIRDFYPGGKKLRHQGPNTWEPNCAFVNVYSGGAENVGYHADQLTYLGPRPVIGSLSLGVAREFRVRRIVPRDKDDKNADDAAADTQGQIAIHLPHNSLLVMHAEMQEEWKHSIAPAASIDPHPVAGNKRINITYRFYRESIHPKYTPRCKCGVPVSLKCSMKSAVNRGRYMWTCDMGYQPGQKNCGYFEWAEFDDDGEPIWPENKKR